LCFVPYVPRKKPIKNPGMDRELDDLLAAIEGAWKQKHGTMRGFVYKKSKGEKGVVPESTWYGWRGGGAAPDFLELRRVARAVGLDVGGVRQDGVDASGSVRLRTSGGGDTLTLETEEVVRLMNNLPEESRKAIRDAAFAANAELHAANPTDAGAEEGSRHARSK
jgi:hypothetical protein